MLSGLLVLDPQAKVIIVSGQGDKQNALRAVGAGAYDFLCKPVDMDELRLVLQRCVYVAQLEREYRAMQESARPDAFEDMLGASPQMQTRVRVRPQGRDDQRAGADARRERDRQGDGGAGAPSPQPVRERPVRGHQLQRHPGEPARERAVRPREGLVHRRAHGAAGPHRDGRGGHALPRRDWRAAGAAPGEAAALLQEKTFQRVGGRLEIQSDARVVAATNTNLQESVANGRFREDLYFRLAVLVVTLPPLRERGDDVGLLAKEFLHRYGVQHSKPGLTFAPDALRALTLHRWPGNVRELQNRVQRAVIMAEGKRVTARDLELADPQHALPVQTLKEAREGVERERVQEALRRHRGKIAPAAAELGISRPTMYELMEKLGIAREAGEKL